MSGRPLEARSPGSSGVWERYGRFLARPPEATLEWHDRRTGATGWLVLNSLRGGAAGGGTRMREGMSRAETVYLAKIMELKFAISGPSIGGAKAGIAFDPEDARKEEVLRGWFREAEPFLRSRWGTAGDLNVDGAREVAPLCREMGLRHPQEGIARGHHALEGRELEQRLEAMKDGLHGPVEGPFGVADLPLQVADLITGFGVARATMRLMERTGRDPAETRVLLEGFGNVGGATALYLARAGLRIVGIVDARGGRVAPTGFGTDQVTDFLRRRQGGMLPPDLPAEERREQRRRFGEMEADMFVCAAASGTVDAPALDRLQDRGVEVLVCGANRPFASAEPGDTSVERQADRQFAVLADVVANCGAARAYAHQMGLDEPASVEELFTSVEETVTGAVDEMVERTDRPDRGLLASALEMTLERVRT